MLVDQGFRIWFVTRLRNFSLPHFPYYLFGPPNLLLLCPLALQPTVGFGLSNNTSPFFPIHHQLSPSSHSHHLKIFFYFFSPSFPGSFSLSRPFQLEWRSFWASYSPPFSPGDPANISFAPLSILLIFSPLLNSLCSRFILLLHSAVKNTTL